VNPKMAWITAAFVVFSACLADGAIRIVRTGATYSTVQLAVNAAIDGDTIEIDSGSYSGSTCNALITKTRIRSISGTSAN